MARLARYQLACGGVETNARTGLNLFREHGVYHVRGFTQSTEGFETRVMAAFSRLQEARAFMAHPFTHPVSRDGSATLRKVAV